MIKDILSEKSSWEILAETRLPIVLYGTGNGADAVLDKFDSLGIKVSEIMASSGFVRDRFFRGYKVKSLEEIDKDYPDFVIALAFASSCDEVIKNIKSLSKNHRVIMPVVPVFGEKVMDRDYLEKNREALENACSLLYDKESKRVFESMVRFQFTGDFSHLFTAESSREAALRAILELTDREDILDLGAYRGDTVEEIFTLFGNISSALCFEPDQKTFKKLSIYAEGKENVTVLNLAAWYEEAEFKFSGGGGRQSTLCKEGKQTVKAAAVDSVLGNGQKITYVKMDVEGAEKEALLGMKNLILCQKPKLSIAAYHRTEDLCTLIPLIHSLNNEYKIYLRHHPYIPFWDTNLYCI